MFNKATYPLWHLILLLVGPFQIQRLRSVLCRRKAPDKPDRPGRR